MQTWTLTWAVRNFVAELMMPPGIWILFVLFALFLFKKNTKLLKISIITCLILIWLSATPIFSQALIVFSQPWMKWPQALQSQSFEMLASSIKPQIIIVLGGGRRKGALESSEYNYQDLYESSLERLRIGARLAHETKLPMLISGGAPDQISMNDWPEAIVMAKILDKEFKLQARWLETQSQTTQENALYTAKILEQENIQDIYLVTHFWHMPRAQRMFEKQGFRVIPVPHGFQSLDYQNPLNYYPNSLEDTRHIWHEMLGMIWYNWRY